MSLHVVQLSLDVARNLHAQLLVELPLLLYLRCRATRGREKMNESQLCTTFRNALRALRRPTLTLLESRDQLVDNVLHCSVMAAKEDKVISLILRLCVFHLMISRRRFLRIWEITGSVCMKMLSKSISMLISTSRPHHLFTNAGSW